ncbi:MAG: hypothetical protein ACLS7Z_00390 [Christensenellales bacterium]
MMEEKSCGLVVQKGGAFRYLEHNQAFLRIEKFPAEVEREFSLTDTGGRAGLRKRGGRRRVMHYLQLESYQLPGYSRA